jgi:hypothetical protein
MRNACECAANTFNKLLQNSKICELKDLACSVSMIKTCFTKPSVLGPKTLGLVTTVA